MSFIFHPNLIFVMILFFTGLEMVCLDEIDNYVEMVLISCVAWNDLDCRKQDTGSYKCKYMFREKEGARTT